MHSYYAENKVAVTTGLKDAMLGYRRMEDYISK
jgi:hypothetical protein